MKEGCHNLDRAVAAPGDEMKFLGLSNSYLKMQEHSYGKVQMTRSPKFRSLVFPLAAAGGSASLLHPFAILP